MPGQQTGLRYLDDLPDQARLGKGYADAMRLPTGRVRTRKFALGRRALSLGDRQRHRLCQGG